MVSDALGSAQRDGPQASHHVMVIGLDGAGFDVIGPLLADGSMPNLARLQENGVWGTLRSTYPPVSEVAWSSFYTGVGPARHGVYGSARFHPQTHRLSLANAESVCAEPMWSWLSERQISSIVVNVPMTHPPAPLQGVLVSGWPGPDARAQLTYPPQVGDELADAVGPSPPAPSRTQLRRQGACKALRSLQAVTEVRMRMCLHLLRTRPWQLFVAAFRTPDTVQHVFLNSAVSDDATPYRLEGRGGDVIRGHYQQLDGVIGELVAAAPDDACVIVMSDHGASIKKHWLYVNAWLASLGLLRWSRLPGMRDISSSLRRRTVRRELRALRIGWAGRLLPDPWLDREIVFPRSSAMLRWPRSVDWRRTRAFCDPGVREGIRINLRGRECDGLVSRGREYQQVVTDIIQAARELRDEETGEPVLEDALPRDALYDGPRVAEAPDVVLVTERTVLRRRPTRDRVAGPARGSLRQGHSTAGMIVAAGPAFAGSRQPLEASIVDVAPTITHLLGAPIPEGLDGRVLTALSGRGLTSPRAMDRRAVALTWQARGATIGQARTR